MTKNSAIRMASRIDVPNPTPTPIPILVPVERTAPGCSVCGVVVKVVVGETGPVDDGVGVVAGIKDEDGDDAESAVAVARGV